MWDFTLSRGSSCGWTLREIWMSDRLLRLKIWGIYLFLRLCSIGSFIKQIFSRIFLRIFDLWEKVCALFFLKEIFLRILGCQNICLCELFLHFNDFFWHWTLYPFWLLMMIDTFARILEICTLLPRHCFSLFLLSL